MITALPVLALASALCSPASTAIQATGDTVAPAFEGIEWVGLSESMTDEFKRVTDSSSFNGQPKRPREASLDAWSGRAVLVLQLPNPFDQGEAVALAELIGRANRDRGLLVAVLLPDHEPEEAVADKDHPRVSDDVYVGFASEESPWRPGGGVHAVVLGPSSEQVGSVELPAGEDELIDLLHVALNRFPAPRLEADLPEPLRAAQAQYFGGDWSRARKSAQKVAKKAAKKDAELAQIARDFVQALDAFELDLKIQIVNADAGNLALERLATVAAAAESGFPKGTAAKTGKEITARQKKQMGRAMAFAAADDYVEILPERPVLFPERASSRGKKYAKKLKAMTNRTATFEGDVTRKARAILARYEGARR